MKLTKDSNVKDLIELFNSGEVKYQHVMDLFGVSRDLVKARLKTVGLHWDNSLKEMVGDPSENDLHIKLDNLFERQRRKRGQTAKQGSQLPKVKGKEPTNVRTKVQSNELTKDITNQQSMVIRRRSSFDIDVELMRELKMQSLIHDKPVYLIVEEAIRKAVEELKKE